MLLFSSQWTGWCSRRLPWKQLRQTNVCPCQGIVCMYLYTQTHTYIECCKAQLKLHCLLWRSAKYRSLLLTCVCVVIHTLCLPVICLKSSSALVKSNYTGPSEIADSPGPMPMQHALYGCQNTKSQISLRSLENVITAAVDTRWPLRCSA